MQNNIFILLLFLKQITLSLADTYGSTVIYNIYKNDLQSEQLSV